MPADKKPRLVRARARRNARAAAAVANPPLTVDLQTVLLPGIGAYAATRGLARIVHSIVTKRAPKWARHAHAIAGVAAFGGVWFLGHKVERIARYHDAVVMGAGLAAFQGLAASYLPARYRWLIADPTRMENMPAPRLPAPAMPVLVPAQEEGEPVFTDDTLDSLTQEDLGEYAALDAKLNDLEDRARQHQARASRPAAVANDPDDGDDRESAPTFDLGILGGGDDVDDLYSGAFDDN